MTKKILTLIMTEEGVTMECLLKMLSPYDCEPHETYNTAREDKIVSKMMGKTVLFYSVYLSEEKYQSARTSAKKGELEEIIDITKEQQIGPRS